MGTGASRVAGERAPRDPRRTSGTTFAVADVRDCYASISPETLAELLGPEAAHAIAFLRRFHECGVRGLPIGPEPSAILANAVLSRLDDAIRRSGVRHLRWVDDIALWGPTADVGRRCVRCRSTTAARSAWICIATKTRILEDRSEAAAVLLGDRDSSIIAAP